jgi:hypothetical protein
VSDRRRVLIVPLQLPAALTPPLPSHEHACSVYANRIASSMHYRRIGRYITLVRRANLTLAASTMHRRCVAKSTWR